MFNVVLCTILLWKLFIAVILWYSKNLLSECTSMLCQPNWGICHALLYRILQSFFYEFWQNTPSIPQNVILSCDSTSTHFAHTPIKCDRRRAWPFSVHVLFVNMDNTWTERLGNLWLSCFYILCVVIRECGCWFLLIKIVKVLHNKKAEGLITQLSTE